MFNKTGPANISRHTPMNRTAAAVMLGCTALTALAIAAAQAATPSPARPQNRDDGTYIEFDVPGSACEAPFPRCTTPTAINPAGVVTGYYADANAALHGFVRDKHGNFTLFDGPSAVCTSYYSWCTTPSAINPKGVITGMYCDAIMCHGFRRTPDGTITPIDPQGSVYTSATSINRAGTIVGKWSDSFFTPSHGFLTTDGSSFTSFDAPGAAGGTNPVGINEKGTIVGSYSDANYQSHGFVRTGDGAITTFDPTDSINTSPTAIDPEGTIVGNYQDRNTLIYHGFERSKDGTITTFDVGVVFAAPTGINPAGTVTGYYQQAAGKGYDQRGFIRDRTGSVVIFDPPGTNLTVSYTFANAINPAGVVTGWYIDPNFLGHGFIRIPNQSAWTHLSR